MPLAGFKRLIRIGKVRLDYVKFRLFQSTAMMLMVSTGTAKLLRDKKNYLIIKYRKY